MANNLPKISSRCQFNCTEAEKLRWEKLWPRGVFSLTVRQLLNEEAEMKEMEDANKIARRKNELIARRSKRH